MATGTPKPARAHVRARVVDLARREHAVRAARVAAHHLTNSQLHPLRAVLQVLRSAP